MNRTVRPLRLVLPFVLALALIAPITEAFGVVADAGHRPFSADVPKANGDPLPRRQYREPYVEISNNTTVTVYQVVKKFNNGQQIANQTGGTLYVKGASQQQWTAIGGPGNYNFHANEGDFQYWKASFNPGALGIGPTEVIQYYFYLTFDFGAENTYIYAGQGFGDLSSRTTNSEPTAATNPFTIRDRPAWIFHANNRVVNGNDVQFWAKVGYITDPNNQATRWVTNGAVYYTVDGSQPSGSLGVGTGSTTAAPFAYSHPESNNQGATSIAGTPMWWQASVPNLLGAAPFGSTVKYKIGFWHSSNNEEKFAEHNAAVNNATFSFQNGTSGDPVLTVNGANANYTTTHVFVDETLGDSQPFDIFFNPGQPATEVEVYTNLNRRDRADDDANGDGYEDGIQPVDGNAVVAGDDTHYYRAYTMNAAGVGQYSLTLPATKTGAYRLTARWKVAGDPNWRWYTNFNANRRDHAIVVSPTAARNINLYEMNVLNVESDDVTPGDQSDDFARRGTLEDLFNASNAPHNNNDRWNLQYLKGLGSNWLWFQPIHPITQEAQQGYDPGSPYSVRNFFEINPLMTVNYNSAGGPNDQANRDAARLAFAGLVSAADNEGVGIMLDAPFNHTAPDSEVSVAGAPIFNLPAPALFRDVEARFYSRADNYGERASSAANIAIAPDRGDFGKWGDVRDVFFGNYSALVTVNPNANGNYNNEADVFDYTSFNWTNDDLPAPGHQNVTRGVWKYFAEYTLYWLTQTGVPAGSDLVKQTTKGIDGLRADFGQGLPPQFWEYAINKTRSRKWNFVFMAESLDGGAVTYRSNRHFDILNENIVFPLKSAGGASDYRAIFEGRRSSYGQSLVLLNNTSHDEENYEDPWQALVRYSVASTVDGVPLIFPGQELGISRTFGYLHYEENFGKQIAHFKRFNSMMPAWNDTVFGNDQLYPVYQGIGQARLGSPALRSPNRFFLNEDGGNQTIYGVAKYETRNGSPAHSDVVFAFANTNRDVAPSGNFHINHDTDSNGVNDYGIKPNRSYGLKNIAAYQAIQTNRRSLYVNRKTGSQLLNDGIFVAMNRVPTAADDPNTPQNESRDAWAAAPFEAQYLKVFDITPPATAPGAPTPLTPNSYGYVIEGAGGLGGVTYTWAAVGPDSEGIQPIYKVTYQVNNGQPGFFYTYNTFNTFQLNAGNTLTVTVQAVNPNEVLNGGSPGAASPTVSLRVISANDDDDGDGLTNAEEDAAGTNPFEPASTFQITSIARTNGGFLVTWSSVAARKYVIDGASTPLGTYSAVSSEVTANGPSTTQFVAAGPAFFRVRLVP